MKDEIANNKDRRSDIKRRQFLYTAHIPEKRCGKDRRKKQKYQISMSAITINEGQVFKLNNVERDWS
jgi:hypothetical protein